MPTPIKQMQDREGAAFYPKTVSSAVYDPETGLPLTSGIPMSRYRTLISNNPESDTSVSGFYYSETFEWAGVSALYDATVGIVSGYSDSDDVAVETLSGAVKVYFSADPTGAEVIVRVYPTTSGQLADPEDARYISGRQLPLIDLGTAYTAELKQDISSGTFKKAVVGGYLTINGHRYYFAHPDYWLNTGDSGYVCDTHHMVVVPAENLATGAMNDTSVTDGGYVGSKMKGSSGALKTAADIIKQDFGVTNILTYREYLVNAVTNGKPSAGGWNDTSIELMNERMVYGASVYEPGCDGSTVPTLYTTNKSQLKLFSERPDIIAIRADYWLRDVVSGTAFAGVRTYGSAVYFGAINTRGVRPAFAVC